MEDGLVLQLDNISFEDFVHRNSIQYWLATEYMHMLGYEDLASFECLIKESTQTFISCNINNYENIIPIYDEESNCVIDYKLTRFACYVIAMNGDPKKPVIAKAQTYFAMQVQQFEAGQPTNSNDLSRISTRDKIKESNKLLSKTAKGAGVIDYAKFNNAGYIGMYNKMNFQLAKERGVEKDKLFDTMGRIELAANLFRITQTEARIKYKHIRGQEALEQAHKDVGSEVRKTIIKNTGTTPEQLPQDNALPNVKKGLKQNYKKLNKH